MAKRNSIIHLGYLLVAVQLLVGVAFAQVAVPAAPPMPGSETENSAVELSPDEAPPVDAEIEDPDVMTLGAKQRSKRKPKKSKSIYKPSSKPAAVAKPRPAAVPLPAAEAAGTAHHLVGLVGMGYFFGSGAGVEYIYQPASWFDYGVSIGQTQAQFQRDTVPNTTEFLRGSDLNVKSFVRFSYYRVVYAGVGLNLSNIEGSYGWKGEGVRVGDIEGDFSAKFLLFDLFIGSEWNFGNYYIGADWVGFGFPSKLSLSTTSTDDLDLTTLVLTGTPTEDRIADEIAQQLKLYGLLLRAGYRF